MKIPDGVIVSYDDEVTPEQVKAIEALVAPEFETGDWVVVEEETPSPPKS